PTVRSASRLVSTLRQRYGAEKIAILVNRADHHSDISHKDIEEALKAPIRFKFPSDYKLALASANKGELIAQSAQGRLAEAYRGLARELIGCASPTATGDASGGFFGWLSPRRVTT